jgi:hypothetical protein
MMTLPAKKKETTHRNPIQSIPHTHTQKMKQQQLLEFLRRSHTMTTASLLDQTTTV